MSSSGGPCADCFTGAVHEGTPTGTTSTIHGLPTYVARPAEGVTPKGLVVMIPDAFGWEFVNNRLLCDAYARKGGFLVYLPDFMAGSCLSSAVLPIMAKVTAPASWLTTLLYKPFWIVRALTLALPAMYRIRQARCRPIVLSFFQALRTSPPPFDTTTTTTNAGAASPLKIGAVGFCWGGNHTVWLCHDAPSTRVARHALQASSSSPGKAGQIEALIDCAFTAHPSFLTVPADIEKVTVPLSVAVGEEDMALSRKGIVAMREILEVKKKGDHECVIMPGAKHGFAVRSLPMDAVQQECAERAEKQALDWFSRWFA